MNAFASFYMLGALASQLILKPLCVEPQLFQKCCFRGPCMLHVKYPPTSSERRASETKPTSNEQSDIPILRYSDIPILRYSDIATLRYSDLAISADLFRASSAWEQTNLSPILGPLAYRLSEPLAYRLSPIGCLLLAACFLLLYRTQKV